MAVSYWAEISPYLLNLWFTGRIGQVLPSKIFPVILCRDSPLLNDLLFTPEEFRLYSIPFPDSLDWIRPYIK